MLELKITIDQKYIQKYGAIFIPGFIGTGERNADNTPKITSVSGSYFPGFETPKEHKDKEVCHVEVSHIEDETKSPCYYCSNNSVKCTSCKEYSDYKMFESAELFCVYDCALYKEGEKCKSAIDCAQNRFRNHVSKKEVNNDTSKN